MKLLSLRLAAGLASLLLATSLSAQTLKLRLLETTDIHVNLVGWDYYQDKPAEEYGLDRTATLIRQARAEVPNSMLFDNGDLLQGSPLGDWVARVQQPTPGQVHPAYRVMNALGYDAANIGNHEFNYGLPFLRQAMAGAAFPLLNANLVLAEQPTQTRSTGRAAKNAFTPYVLLERRFTDEEGRPQTLKVGVIGFAPPQVLQWDRANLLGRIAARDIPATALEMVPRMKAEGADVVVVIAHSGFERGETVFFGENTVARLAEVPGVNAVLFGHSHGQFPGRFFGQHPRVDVDKGTINGVPATMPGFWGSHLGVIDLTLERQGGQWRVTDGRAALRAIADPRTRKALVAPDPQVLQLVRAEHEGTMAWMRAEVARTKTPIHSYFARVMDDASVQLVSDAQLAYARRALASTRWAALPLLSAAAPFKSGGRGGAGAYTDIAAGPLALRNVADLYIYPNTVQVVKLSGAQVREWLEFSAGAFNRIDPAGPREQPLVNESRPGFNFDMIDGLSYRIDVTQPARYDASGKLVAPGARRIVDLRHAGQPLDDKAEFGVVTNNYRASGGGNFPGLDGSNIIFEAPDETRQALVEHLRAAGDFEARADGNWRIDAVPGVQLQFVSGSGALAHLAGQKQVRLLKDNGDGTSLFELLP